MVTPRVETALNKKCGSETRFCTVWLQKCINAYCIMNKFLSVRMCQSNLCITSDVELTSIIDRLTDRYCNICSYDLVLNTYTHQYNTIPLTLSSMGDFTDKRNPMEVVKLNLFHHISVTSDALA